MRRYWIEKKYLTASEVIFQGDLFHHIFDVCRQDIGSHFEVITEDSKAFLVEVTQRNKKQAIAKILEERQINSLKKPYIHLCLSIPKFATLDKVLEKAVEMGVHSFHPLISNFSYIKNLSEKDWLHKTERWKKIIISATQQSGRGDLLKLSPPRSLSGLLEEMNHSSGSICLMLYEGDAKNDIKSHITQVRSQLSQDVESIWIIVSSEGGFSKKEVNLLQDQGFSPVTMGEQILRVETACIAAISVLKYEFDLMKGVSYEQ
ncbi:MAG: 16S rRNA (uracil(1498)-N(3))-methyltransferase [Bdellovibrionales bacterium]|nr:16S rRNA (uracil(1498)-N(3))-methyltransferase [Bdellovibrionales bacterium]